MHPARSQAVVHNRELQHRSRDGAVLAPKVGLCGVAHNNDCGRGFGHKARAIVAHLGDLVYGFAVIDNHKARGVHIA